MKRTGCWIVWTKRISRTPSAAPNSRPCGRKSAPPGETAIRVDSRPFAGTLAPMIAYLLGKLAEAHPTQVVVDCGGVGYSVFIPLSSYDKLPAKGGEVKLLTYHHVVAHEGTQQLFGFATAEEREMFLLLISIS